MEDIDSLVACHECDLLIEKPRLIHGETALCPRCNATVQQSKKDSFNRSQALSITGLLLFIPANLYPFLYMSMIGKKQSETIYQGSLSLFNDGFWFVASLVFLCSILVPLTELSLVLHLSTRLKQNLIDPKLKNVLRFYQSITTWGMLEVYMIGILVSVVKLYGMAELKPGIGLYCLIGVLLITVLINIHFDKEQAWQAIEDSEAKCLA